MQPMHLFSRQFPSNISEMEFHHWLVFRSMNASLYREGGGGQGGRDLPPIEGDVSFLGRFHRNWNRGCASER